MNMIEKVARAICKAEGVDPEHACFGLGKRIPKGDTWPAWWVRIPQAKAALEAMRNMDQKSLSAAVDATGFHWTAPNETGWRGSPQMLFEVAFNGAIDAALDDT